MPLSPCWLVLSLDSTFAGKSRLSCLYVHHSWLSVIWSKLLSWTVSQMPLMILQRKQIYFVVMPLLTTRLCNHLQMRIWSLRSIESLWVQSLMSLVKQTSKLALDLVYLNSQHLLAWLSCSMQLVFCWKLTGVWRFKM